MADALDSGSSRGCSVRVQVPSPAPKGGYNLNDYHPPFFDKNRINKGF